MGTFFSGGRGGGGGCEKEDFVELLTADVVLRKPGKSEGESVVMWDFDLDSGE